MRHRQQQLLEGIHACDVVIAQALAHYKLDTVNHQPPLIAVRGAYDRRRDLRDQLFRVEAQLNAARARKYQDKQARADEVRRLLAQIAWEECESNVRPDELVPDPHGRLARLLEK